MKDGQYISPNSSREMFEILEIKRADSGTYQCVASNELGAITSKKGSVEVAYMEFLQDTTDKVIDISQGHAVVLPLPHIESVPKPTVLWLEGTSPLEIFGGRHQVTLNGSLAILDPNINEDGFRYRARFTNGFAMDNDNQYSPWYTLNIQGNGDEFIGPELVVPISDATAHVADMQVDFECVFNARPLSSLTVFWYKVASDGSRTLVDKNNPDKYILPTHDRSLKVRNIQPADAGYYECEGVFSHPARSFPPVTARASLTVYEPPSFSVQIPSMQTRGYGQSIDFVCLTVGVPQPQVVWYFNSVPISSTDTRYQIHANGVLHVDKLDLPDAGMYQCFANNQAGEIKKSIRLAVKLVNYFSECSPNPCLNGGYCIEEVNKYRCICHRGYTGDRCGTNINDCSPQPCQNGGFCIDEVNEYNCSCVAGYTGDQCEIDTNECSPQPCQNGGFCIDGVNEYNCSCIAGYTGDQCQIDINECSPQPCQNGGFCTDGVNEYNCSCLAGYTGDQCQNDINECASNPCENGGDCMDGVNAYQCSCPAGFVGDHCERGINATKGDTDLLRTSSDKETGIILGVVISVLLIAIAAVIVVVYIIRRRRRKKPLTDGNS